MAILIIEISWEPDVIAELISLRDNNRELLPMSIKDNDGLITLQWEANDLIAHYIDWQLVAGDQTMKKLEAIAHWENGAPRSLAKQKEAEGLWKSGGHL